MLVFHSLGRYICVTDLI